MRICVYVAGSIGGVIGGVLADAGHNVSLIARGPHLAALQAKGLHGRDWRQDVHRSSPMQ